mmetsp:Transcript_5945/g.13802  ORF Transcript_5945/g.13802 Transcript_5945/m.13802 type:complete len:266 (+) Transcript_5945:146-943(+)
MERGAMVPAVGAARVDKTVSRLDSLVSKFHAFESEMLEGTRQRREKDEHVLVELKEEMAGLEQCLQNEVKRRENMIRSLQKKFGDDIETTKDELIERLRESMVLLDDKVVKLNERVDALEQALEVQKKIIPEDIERRGAELTERLERFSEKFEEERLSRLEREREITARLAAHESKVADELEEERSCREQKYQELKAILEESVSLRKSRTERFHVFLEKEIAVLKNSIQEESALREKEDDEIVETLTRYTAKLQDSLRVINTTEV